MTQSHPKNIAASARQRLLNKARETARPLTELLQYDPMEGFHYRLSHGEARPIISHLTRKVLDDGAIEQSKSEARLKGGAAMLSRLPQSSQAL